MGAWESNEGLLTVAKTAFLKFKMMILDETGSVPGAEWWPSMEADLNEVTSLDPQVFVNEYDRLWKIYSRMPGDQKVNADLDAAREHLGDWHGDTKDAFGRQISYIETFMETQQTATREALTYIEALFTAAVGVRQQYKNLMDGTIKAIDSFMAGQRAEKINFAIGTVGDLVKDVIGGGGKLPATLANMAVSLVKNGLTHDINLKDWITVSTDYADGAVRMKNDRQTSIGTLVGHLGGKLSWIVNEPVILEPLPSSAQVGSPDFRYESFDSTNMDAQDFGGKVDQENQRKAQSGTQAPESGEGGEPSRISLVL